MWFRTVWLWTSYWPDGGGPIVPAGPCISGGEDAGVVVAGVVGAGVVGAGVVAAGVVLAVSFLSSLLKTPPMARAATISAITTTAASAIQGAFEPPLARCGAPPMGPPA